MSLYAGPGTGKSTTAAALFAELKYLGHNVELVPEFAKDLAWEKRGPKILAAQEYIFAKQNFRLSRVIGEVDLIITDCPILLTCVYTPEDFYMSSLTQCAVEAHQRYDNLDVFLDRNKPFNPKGRFHSLEEAIEVDKKILSLLDKKGIPYERMPFGRDNVDKILRILYERQWIK